MMYKCSKKLAKCKEYAVVLTILSFQHFQYLHLMYAEVAWVLVSSGTQVQPQIILDPDYLLDYLSVSYYYGSPEFIQVLQSTLKILLNYTIAMT